MHCHIRFEYAGNLNVGVEIFESVRKEFRIKKNVYPDTYVGRRGLKVARESF